jgi:hypothetical protein
MRHKIKGIKGNVPIHAVKAEGGTGGVSPLILHLGAEWSWVITSRPVALPWERTRVPTYIGSWVGHREGLDLFCKAEKSVAPMGIGTPNRPSCSPVAIPTPNYRGSSARKYLCSKLKLLFVFTRPERITYTVSLLSCPWALQLSWNARPFMAHNISRGISNKLAIFFNPLLPLSFIQAYYHDKASNLLKTRVKGREMGIREKKIGCTLRYFITHL